MARIAFFQNRLGRTDGVSLEVDKWRRILEERLGHTVVYCSGNDDVPGNYVIPELYAHHPVTWKILQNGTVAFREYEDESELERDIYAHADVLERKLLEFIREERIDVLVPNNLCSGGYQPAAGIALHRVIRATGLPTIVHSHDFYFEDSGEVDATCHTVASIYERYFPPKLPNVQHVVINRVSQGEVLKRKRISATVVPNVFDFDQPRWQADDFNIGFREAFGVGPDDIVFLQATRILDRKGIELAVDLVERIGHDDMRSRLAGFRTAGGGTFGAESRLVLMCAGIVESIGITGSYWDKLRRKAQRLGVNLVHVGDRVRHSRGTTQSGKRVFSLWDSYVWSDFVTYPSQWEGWGNQFVEAVFARLPVVVFEYPVWVSDLAEAGFRVVSLGDQTNGVDADGLVTVSPERIESCSRAMVGILSDRALREEIVSHNFTVAAERYSLGVLHGHIERLLATAGSLDA